MVNLLKADCYKLFKSLSLRLSFLFCIFCAALLTFVMHGLSTGDVSASVSSNASMLVDSMIVAILGGVIIAGTICSDFDSKEIHSEITGGYSRFKIMTEKMIMYIIILVILTLPYALASIIGLAMDGKFSALVGIPSPYFKLLANMGGVDITGKMVGKSIVLCLVFALLYIAKLSICLPVAFKTRKIIPVIIVAILSVFVFDMIVSYSADIDSLDNIMKLLPYAWIYKLDLTSSISTIAQATICAVVFSGVMFVITYFLFRKSEIK